MFCFRVDSRLTRSYTSARGCSVKTSLKTFSIFFAAASACLLFSCVNIASFTVVHPIAVAKSQFTNVVVVPLPSINGLKSNELLGGERVFSDFAERVFKTATCRVVRAEQVRKDLKIAPYDASISLAKISQFSRAGRGLSWIEFANLERSGGWGNPANGYIQGDIVVHLLDKMRQPLLTCSGSVHAENGTGWSPGFDVLLSRGFDDSVEPKLNAVLE